MADDIAEGLLANNKVDEAIARLEELLAGDENPGMRLRLGSICFQQGKIGDALAHARRASESESEHREDAILLVAYACRTLKRYREAARTFTDFAENFSDSKNVRTALFSAALCMEELDDWSGAIEIYSKIGDDEAQFRQAICMERGGRPDEAAAIFEMFLERHAESPELLKVRYRLGAMRLRQGRTEEAIKHLEQAVSLGSDTFIGQLANQLLDRARTKHAQMAKKLKGYS